MKTGSKILLGVSGAVLLVAGSVAGTLAFLTDDDTVTNTFTIGKVDISLTETAVKPDGTPDEGAERVKENEYRLVPGVTYTKDPILAIEPDSESAYIRMIVRVQNWEAAKAAFGSLEEIVNLDTANWTAVQLEEDGLDGNTKIYEYRYKESPIANATNEAIELPALFTELTVPGDLTSEELGALYTGDEKTDFRITVEGHAIQSTGFASADAAWTAFDNQENPTEATTATE
ncbi:MAG: hypothetical protein IJY06_03395 [Oscillospiraceae bacterium]|nr:hypothetical protein [Oscillospiraceae bacterium]